MKYHPDRSASLSDKEKKEAEEKFKEIQAAYAVLSDPQKKQMYDQFGHDGLSGMNGGAGGGGFHQGGGFEDIFRDFGDFFGGGGRGGRGGGQTSVGQDLEFAVEITLEEDEEESTFVYSKSSQSEWSERTTNVIGITLTKNEIDFINNYVLNINGGDNDVVVNFKKDFIMTDDDEELLTDLKDRVDKETRDYTPEEIDGELDDWYSFTTNGDEQDEITIDENGSLQVEVSNSYTTYRDDNNF
jgi:hypothetical protein